MPRFANMTFNSFWDASAIAWSVVICKFLNLSIPSGMLQQTSYFTNIHSMLPPYKNYGYKLSPLANIFVTLNTVITIRKFHLVI